MIAIFLQEGIFLTCRFEPVGFLHLESADSIPLSHQGSPKRVGADCKTRVDTERSDCADDGDPLRVAEMVVSTSRVWEAQVHPTTGQGFNDIYLAGFAGSSCSKRIFTLRCSIALTLEAYGDVVH